MKLCESFHIAPEIGQGPRPIIPIVLSPVPVPVAVSVPLMAYSDRTYMGMGPGPGPGLMWVPVPHKLQCEGSA